MGGTEEETERKLQQATLLKKSHPPFFVTSKIGYSYCTFNIIRLFSFEIPSTISPGMANLIRIIFSKYILVILIVLIQRSWVRLSPLSTSLVNGLLYQPRIRNKFGVFGAMRIGRGNRSTLKKRAPVPLCQL
jgi:hypothetical protein